MALPSTANDATRRRSILAGAFAGAAGLAAAVGALPGTSATARAATAEDGTTDWINVVSGYGADPTGAADSTSAIQNAIGACPIGGVVYFPAGSYTVSAPLLIKNAGTRLLGSHSGNNGFEGGGSNAAIINAAASFSGDAILDSNGQADLSVRDLNVHGHNLTRGTTMGININGGALLEDVLVAYTVGTGIKIRNGVTVMHQVGVFHAGNSTGAGSGFDIDEADCWYSHCLSSGHATSGWASGRRAHPDQGASGALIGKTADQSSAWASSGLNTAALAGGPFYLSQGWVYVVILGNGTTRPAFGRATVQGSGAVNAGLTVSTARYAVNSSARTTLPASITMSGNAFSATTYWAALS